MKNKMKKQSNNFTESLSAQVDNETNSPFCPDFVSGSNRPTTEITNTQLPLAPTEEIVLYNNTNKTQFQAQKANELLPTNNPFVPDAIANSFLKQVSQTNKELIHNPSLRDLTESSGKIFQVIQSQIGHSFEEGSEMKMDDIESINSILSNQPNNNNPSEIIGVSKVGIDTVWLHLFIKPQTVQAIHSLTVKPASGKRKPCPIFIDSTGECVSGEKAFYNGDDIYVDIYPLGIVNGYTSSLKGSSVCIIHFSVAKIYGEGDNTNIVGIVETEEVFKRVAKKVDAIGIKVDLSQARVIRLDLMCNLYVSNPVVKEYSDVFRKIIVSRKSKSTPGSPLEKTILDSNKGEAFSIYDKNAERGRSASKGILRVEWQLKKSANIRKALGLNSVTINELLNNFDSLACIYKQAINRTYFAPFETKITPRRFNDGKVGHRLNTLFSVLQQYGWNAGNSSHNLQMTLDSFGFTDLVDVIKQVSKGADKSQRNKLTRCLLELRKAIVWEALEDPDFARKYNELQQWLLK